MNLMAWSIVGQEPARHPASESRDFRSVCIITPFGTRSMPQPFGQHCLVPARNGPASMQQKSFPAWKSESLRNRPSANGSHQAAVPRLQISAQTHPFFIVDQSILRPTAGAKRAAWMAVTTQLTSLSQKRKIQRFSVIGNFMVGRKRRSNEYEMRNSRGRDHVSGLFCRVRNGDARSVRAIESTVHGADDFEHRPGICREEPHS